MAAPSESSMRTPGPIPAQPSARKRSGGPSRRPLRDRGHHQTSEQLREREHGGDDEERRSQRSWLAVLRRRVLRDARQERQPRARHEHDRQPVRHPAPPAQGRDADREQHAQDDGWRGRQPEERSGPGHLVLSAGPEGCADEDDRRRQPRPAPRP